MRCFLRVLGLGAVSALVGCSPAGDTGPPPTGPTAGPSAAGDPVTSPSPAAPAGPGALTPENTKIEFVGTKKDGQHSGSFTKFSGRFSPIDGDFAASRLTIDIDADSLESDNPKLTGHLKAPDFFDVRKYPKASFVSTGIKEDATGDATHAIVGDLTLHGTTKTITIPVKVTQTEDLLTLDGTFTINRLDYGIAYQPEAVDPIVTIKVSAKVARQ